VKVKGDATALAPSAPVPYIAVSPEYGLNMFVWAQPKTTDRDLRMATDARIQWQKSLFQWRDIEGKGKGQFDWTESDRVVQASNKAGLKIIARLDFPPAWAKKDDSLNGPPDNYQDYADFVAAFVNRYKTGSPNGRVQAIEIWNEPNVNREWGNAVIDRSQAADYVRLLAGAYSAAKRADPNITVISAGLAPVASADGQMADDLEYLNWLYDAGFRGKFDVLGAHGNAGAPQVDAVPGSLETFPHPSSYFRRIEQLRDLMVARGDAAKQIWLTEFGWTSEKRTDNSAPPSVSEDQKAQNIVKAFQYARDHWQPWIGVMNVWSLANPTWTKDQEEYWWAITNTDGSPRPAYNLLRDARTKGVLP
jgi:hypothetical protein